MTATSAPAGVRLARLRWWHLDAVLRAEDVLFGDEAWAAEVFWSELAQPGRTWLAALGPGGSLLGYGGLASYPEEAFVQNLAVLPPAQGRRVGSLLLDALLGAAAARDCPLVGLEVRADNEPAQRLYRRRGFRVVGRRRGYYQPSGADALVMLREGATAAAEPAGAGGRGTR